jgi:7-cyano-7-deazaguanine synthase
MTTAIIALSSGLDCVTSLALALEAGVEVKQALFFDYGQKAANKEVFSASIIADHYNVPFDVIDLPFLKNITKTALVNVDSDIPNPDASRLDAVFEMQATAASVWVPNRNGLILNILAAYADSFEYDEIILGTNAEEAITFPDNSPQGMAAVTEALQYTTQHQPIVKSYVQSFNKMEIAQKAIDLDVPLHFLWSCYHGGEKFCGKCESCKRFTRGFTATGNWDKVKDNFADPSLVG